MKNKTATKWWSKNWKWFISLMGFILACLMMAYAITQGNFKDIAQVYVDPKLFQEAISEANHDNDVIQVIGTIEPLDNLAILEGNAQYTENNKSVVASVRVVGKKTKGKMDITAKKIGSEWEYETIKIRVRDTQQVIIVK